MTRSVELRRHTDNEGDALTPAGVERALEIGAELSGGYDVIVSSGAQRATQTIACFLAMGASLVERGCTVDTRWRSDREDEWKAAYKAAGAGDIASFRRVAPQLVAEESDAFGSALKDLFESLEDGRRALVVGHSPMLEAGVWALTGEEIEPLSKGAGVLVRQDGDTYSVEALG